ncbi:PREDICTED: deoxycytidylate deaminase-like [Amphimedon queenslandica]|nr:PREDICTED: deoxycytidylate deaminase-like [Amphimedon queenslandica]|eukprot:XP_011408034.2 PREDICTED: deoxycytidylate deaminase-like [Amphimedon queenslandica]
MPKDTTKTDPKLKHPYVVHAAVNAVLNKTRESIKGCTIYVTHFPENDCAHAIIEAEIREVVYLKWNSSNREKDYDRIKELLDNNSVELREIMREKIEEENDLKVVTELEHRIANKSDVDADKAARTMAISWEQFFMGIAELSKTRPGEDKNSKCIVGACIVSPSKQVMAVGYSGYPEDMEKIGDKAYQGYNASHAEYKAIIKTPSVKGCTLYVTKEPCCVCAKMIVQAGISKVIYKDEGKGDKYAASKITLPTCLKIRQTQVETVWNRPKIPRHSEPS